MAKATVPRNIEMQLAAAREELVAAVAHEGAVIESESASLSSDADYIAWSRRKRLAESERQRLISLIASLEARQVEDERVKNLEEFDRRYNAAADANDRVAVMLREELPQAWKILSSVMLAAAEAEIEASAVRRAMPASYHPKRPLIDPDSSVRCRSASPERILSQEITELFVDPKTNGLFADQSAPPTNRSFVKRQFRVTSYSLSRRAQDVPPFVRSLVFPRLSDFGPAMFDGTKISSPQDVIAQLTQQEQRVEPRADPLTRIEPV